jgi:nitric oxide reductase subunit B
MLGIGLMLFVLRGLFKKYEWKDGLIKFSFWSINIGLLLMVVISVLPIGILQTKASIEVGMWYARSADFMQQPIMQIFRWLRVIGDVIFAAGTITLAIFVIGLKTGWSIDKNKPRIERKKEITIEKRKAKEPVLN